MTAAVPFVRLDLTQGIYEFYPGKVLHLTTWTVQRYTIKKVPRIVEPTQAEINAFSPTVFSAYCNAHRWFHIKFWNFFPYQPPVQQLVVITQ